MRSCATSCKLARVEVTEDVGRLGRAGGMLGGAAFAGYMTLLLMSFGGGVGSERAAPDRAGVPDRRPRLGRCRRRPVLRRASAVARAADIKPEQTIETMQENLKWAKQQTS